MHDVRLQWHTGAKSRTLFRLLTTALDTDVMVPLITTIAPLWPGQLHHYRSSGASYVSPINKKDLKLR